MSAKPDYLKELEALLESMDIEDLAREIGITSRSIMNYKSKESPVTPFKKTIDKIHEVFMKHQHSANHSEQDLINSIRAKKERLPLEQAILNLTDAQKINAEANLIHAKAALLNAENIRDLITMKEGRHEKQETPLNSKIDPNLNKVGNPGIREME